MAEEKKFEKKIKGLYIDPLIFTHKFVKGCDACICTGECCYYGVYTDKYEADKILAMKDKVIAAMDDSQIKDPDKWFEPPEKDEDFESGIAVGTQVYNGKCVFLDKIGYCTLQKMAMKEGIYKWEYKPFYCIIFPLVVYEGALTIDDDHLNRLHYCNKPENQPSTVFETCKDEIIHILGEDGYKELAEYREEYFKKQNEGKVEIKG
ncbi:DUF3109 family protein [Melioribacter sp. Ez-97]|uniref:DUF3109 family protein n=1 Tax=Melioribacter sp. Ez-97 TaxID=3423434 RepID=UPI003EDB2FE7